MTVVVTGRPLDAAGRPTDGPAIELEAGGRTITNLRERAGPLVSGPSSGIWGTLLARPEDLDGAHPAFLGILAPGVEGAPPHYHPREPETFEVLEGELTLVVDGEVRILAPGEELTVRPGERHTFRNDADEFTAIVAEMSSMLDYEAQVTLFGMDHDGKLGPGGRPPVFHLAVMTAAMRENTVFTLLPGPFMVALRVVGAPVGRAMGHRPVCGRYLTAAFWESRVEQPER